MAKIIKPHNVKSVNVTEKDIKRVLEDAKNLYKLCFKPSGIYQGGIAVAHQQITKINPLRFFVTQENEVIINPVIIKHTKTPVDSTEGCLSFPNLKEKIVNRWNKCEVEYKILDKNGNISNTIIEKLSGGRSKMFQHEIDHFDCKYIYEI